MIELIHKRNWDSKVFDTGRIDDKERPIYGTKIQNGLHDIEPDGSFVECNPLLQPSSKGVSTDEAIRTRCGEVRISDTNHESKQLAKVKSKDLEGISLKLKGIRTYGPSLPTLKEAVYSTNDGVTVRQFPNYKGINIVLEIANPQTASNVYEFTIKEYGCDYTYEEINGDIKCISSSGKSDIWIKALYAVDANGDYGSVSMRLGGVTAEGYQIVEKTINPIWLGNAVGPVEIDPSVTIDDDSGTLEDNMLIDSGPDDNYGGFSQLQVEDNRNTLMKVDLSAYSGITVSSAKFGIDIYDFTSSKTIGWYKVLLSWVEGTSSGAIESGTSCWNYREYNTLSWNTGGCRGAGSDRNATAEGTSDITANNSDYPLDLTTATVQDWIDNISNNHGICIDWISGGTTPSRFRSSEATLGNKPYFYMEYTSAANGFPFFFDAGHY